MAFEFDGEKYTEASCHQKEWGVKLISEFHFKGSEYILDLGSGDGILTAQLAENVPDGYVLGIDSSKGMVETAQKNHSLPNLNFELLDIHSIHFHNRFDIVISNATLHWVKDHNKLLDNVHVALKNNGITRFNFAAHGNCSFFYRVIKSAMKLPEYAEYFNNFVWPWYMPKVDEYTAIAEQSPLTEVKVWGENADRNFDDADALIKWIDQPSIVPFLNHIRENDKKAFRDIVVRQMIKDTRQPDGSCFETFRRINLYAKKGGPVHSQVYI